MPAEQPATPDAGDALVRAILEAACARDGISLDSAVDDGPARNYELALRLGIGRVFGIGDAGAAAPPPAAPPASGMCERLRELVIEILDEFERVLTHTETTNLIGRDDLAGWRERAGLEARNGA